MKTTLLATLTLAALATPPLAAQDEAAVRRQDAEAWVLRQAGADRFLDAEELARALAEIAVVIEVDRDEPTAEFRFSELVNHGWAGLKDRPADAGRREVLRTVIEAYGTFHAERGRLEVALHVLGEDPEQLGDTPADAALRAIYDDPRLVQARDRLRVQLGDLSEPGTSGEADPVRTAVERALQNNDPSFIARLGTAALPALESMIRETPDELQLRGMDPLASLASIDPTRAIALIGEIDPRGGAVWRSRVLEALRTTDLLDTSGSGVVYPAAFETLARYMTRAETREPAWELTSNVRELVLPAALRGILRESVASADPAARARGLSLLWEARGDEQVKALARELLASPYVDARRQAATIVADLHGERGPLPALARDEDPSIRVIAAKALRGSRTAAEQEALELLLTDRDEFVRRVALQSVREPKRSVVTVRSPRGYEVWSQPPGAEVMRALADDPNPEIRSAILDKFQEVPDVAILPFLEVALAGPSAAEVVAHARDVVPRLLLLRAEDTPRYFATVRRLVELEPELPRSDRTWNDAAASWKEDPAELRAFVDLACETENAYLLQKLLEDPNQGGVRQRGGALDPRLSALDPESWARIARAADRSDVADAEVARIVAEMPDGARETLAALTRDEATSPALRFVAATRLLREGDPSVETTFLGGLRSEALAGSLREPTRNTITPARPLARTALEMWWKVDGARRNALIARFLADPLVPDETAAAFAAGFDPAAADGPTLARALLDRWQPRARAEEQARKVVESVLWGMVHAPATRDDAVLRESLLTDGLQQRALEVVERLRDPAHLPALAEYLRTGDYFERRKQALRVVASYQNEKAVQALVDAAASSREDEVAQYALEMLERIRQLHAARELWRELASEKHSREGSVAELLALLEDESEAVRVQAVRGLATFGAIEAIPALIRRMKDASPTLRAEVEAALEKLNRSEGE